MAMYWCDECQQLLDDDYHPCSEHPDHPEGLICPDCDLALQERREDNADYDYDERVQRGRKYG